MGSGVLKNQVWWFNWADFTMTEGATKTITTNDGLSLTVTFSNLSSRTPLPAAMSNYYGAILRFLYNFSDPSIRPALLDNNTTGVCKFTMTISASRNGVPAPFSLVAADAEASGPGEQMIFHSTGSPWQTLALYRNSDQTSDPVAGCQTQSAIISNTYNGQTEKGQSPVISTSALAATPLVVDVTFDHGISYGGIAASFGVLQADDRGDLPASYGYAQHQISYTLLNPCNYLDPLPSLNPIQNLYLGSVPPDADPIQYADDNAIGVDEEGVSGFPVYGGNGNYTLTTNINNSTGRDAYLSAWFDFDRNGIFSPNEGKIITVHAHTTSVAVTWTKLPNNFPQGAISGYGFRFRLSSDLQSVQSPTGFAPDGEVEDYYVPALTLCAPVHPAVSPDLSICTGQIVSLQASGAATYTWTPGTGLSNAAVPNPRASPKTTTSYTLTATTLQGCTGTASVTIAVNPVFNINISGDTLICKGSTTSLNVSGGTIYNWTSSDHLFNASGPSVNVTPARPTFYYVNGKDVNGCPVADSFLVDIHSPSPAAVTPEKADVCRDDTIRLSAHGGDSYSWTAPDGSESGTLPDILINPSTNATWHVQVTDNICHTSSGLSVPITIKPLPVISISSTSNVDCILGQASLHATGASSWAWTNNGSLSDPASADPVISPLTKTMYYVKGTDRDGCSSMDSILVEADLSDKESHYPVPSAFSPNNDGHNDCFGLQHWTRVSSLAMSVYNRYGQRVFFTNSTQQCWDGTLNGTPQPAGAYVYEIRAVTVCGTAVRKGIVILVR
jgi:gliding motility-associated-like protein